MRLIAHSGNWTLEAQVRAYDLLELLCDYAIEGEVAAHFCKEYDALAPALGGTYHVPQGHLHAVLLPSIVATNAHVASAH